MKLIDSAGNVVTDNFGDGLGKVHLELSPLDKGRELSRAQPKMGTIEGDYFVVGQLDFAAMAGAYLLVRECDDDFFQCMPGFDILAQVWRAISRGVNDWSEYL